MLYNLFSLIIILPILIGFGEIFGKIFGKIWLGISAKIAEGIFVLSMVFTVLSFIISINFWVEMAVLTIGISAFFYFKSYQEFYKISKKNKIYLALFLFITLFFSSYFPFILDHFGYYVPTIKWISEVGLVQGISNLDLLLGQMSIWHIFQSGFAHFSDPFFRMNGILVIAFFIYILENKTWIMFLFVPFFFFFVQSPSPDLPTIIFSLIILNEILSKNKNSTLLFAFSVFVFALKPTMIWIPILSFSYSFLILKKNLKFTIFGVLIGAIFVFKNIWTFGYPIFPIQFFDLGISWKPNQELMNTSAKVAVQKTFDMQFSSEEISKFSSFDYTKNWFALKGIKAKIHLLFIVSLLVFLIFAMKKKSKLVWLVLISIFIKSIFVLYFSAQYRFFMEVFFVVFFIIFYEIIKKKTALMFFGILTFFAFIFLSFPTILQQNLPSFKLGGFMQGFQRSQLYQPSYFALNKYETHQIGNLKFNIVEDYPFSFDTPIPAISPEFLQEDLDAGIFPQLKGKTVKEGFIWRKISEKEKIDLQNILKKKWQ